MANLENIIEVSEATFEREVIEKSYELPVVVDFWAPWCGPCRILGPVLERLAADPGLKFLLAKVNVDNNPNLSMHYQVRGIPAVKAFKDGQIVGEFVGAQPEPRVRQFIQNIAASETDNTLSQANSLLATHHWAEAEAAYYEILAQRPHEATAVVNLGRALLAQGKGCEAIPYLERCKDGQAWVQAERLMPLAIYLCRTEAEDREEMDADSPLEAQYRQVARLWRRQNMAAAMDGLLDVLRQDKRYRDEEPKRVMLAIFELLGDDDDLTQTYRRELASVLF